MSSLASLVFLALTTTKASRLLLQNPNGCNLDIFTCPSGSTVIRDSNNYCEFPPCICGGFPNCNSYTPDGCNECLCYDNGQDACTSKSCDTPTNAQCLICTDGYTHNPANNECELLACTQEIKTCSDGKEVIRNPFRNCVFDPCVGDVCGIPDTDCKLPIECIKESCPDNTCYGCVCNEECTYEYDNTNTLKCSSITPKDRVCPDAITTNIPIQPSNTLPPFCYNVDCNTAGANNPCCGGDPCAACENSQACQVATCLVGSKCCDNGLGDGQAICCPGDPEPPIEPSPTNCEKMGFGQCYNEMSGLCDIWETCGGEYCGVDAKCNAFPDAICQFSSCGGCYEIFIDYEENIIENCDIDICSLVPEIGPCKAAITKYYYDKESNKCEEFVYGGCGGNGNNFDSKNDCNAACKIYQYGDPNVNGN
eukprot:505317_1